MPKTRVVDDIMEYILFLYVRNVIVALMTNVLKLRPVTFFVKRDTIL